MEVGPSMKPISMHLSFSVRRSLLRRSIHAGLALGILSLALGAVAGFGGAGAGLGGAPVFGLGILIGWGVTFAVVRWTVSRPLARIAASTEALADQDAAALSDGLLAVAQGDLTNRLEPRAHRVTLPPATSPQVERLGEAVNVITARLADGAAQLNNVTDEGCRRLFYVGPDGYLQGRECGELMGRAIGGRGQVLVLSGILQHAGLELRRKGFQAMLRERYPDVEVLDVVECSLDQATVRARTAPLLKKYPHLAGIYSTVIAAGAARAVQEAGLAGRVRIICHDLTEDLVPYVAKDTISVTISQDPFAQGYDTAVHLFNHLATGWQPVESRLLTAMDQVTQANLDQFWKNGKGLVQSDAMIARRPKPMGASTSRLRIVFLGVEDSDFWIPVREGVLTAARELRPLGADVEWIVPEPGKAFDLAIRAAAIESLVDQGCNAIATPIMDTGLVASLNAAAAAGVAVAAFNSETSSLRGLMYTLSHRSNRLMEVSKDLLTSADASGASTREIADTVSRMATATGNEAAAVTQATFSMQRIAGSVGAIAEGARDQARAADSLSQTATHISRAVEIAESRSETVVAATTQAVATADRGSDSLRQTLRQMASIEKAVTSSASIIGETNANAQKIGEIVAAIEDIAAQTNLLALNAAIEAARAGEQGKGFAVVASEVRKLAEKSADATKEIGAIITTVQASAGRAAAAMDAAVEKVREGSTLAEHSGQALDQLLQSAISTQRQTGEMVDANHAVASVMGDLTTAIDQVSSVAAGNLERSETAAAAIREAMRVVDNVSAISQENAASAQYVAGTIVELADQAQDVQEAAAALTGIARELEGSTAKFKIDVDRGVASAAETPAQRATTRATAAGNAGPPQNSGRARAA
jgi:methyl-accepting chemotaxis protein